MTVMLRLALLLLAAAAVLGLTGCHHPEIGEDVRKTIKKLDYQGGR